MWSRNNNVTHISNLKTTKYIKFIYNPLNTFTSTNIKCLMYVCRQCEHVDNRMKKLYRHLGLKVGMKMKSIILQVRPPVGCDISPIPQVEASPLTWIIFTGWPHVDFSCPLSFISRQVIIIYSLFDSFSLCPCTWSIMHDQGSI